MFSSPVSAPTLYLSDFVIIQGNSLKGISPPVLSQTQVLASKISYCESGDDPTAKNPNSTAYGLCGFLDGTWAYVQDKWKITLDRDDEDDQWYTCQRLLEEEGTVHWKASESCWREP